MLSVKQVENGWLAVTTGYMPDYIRRIKRLPGVHYDSNTKIWYIPQAHAPYLEQEFKGELVYMTPKWQILNMPPPDYRAIYTGIPNHKVNTLLPLYDYQNFGANFLAHTVMQYGMACCFDAMGVGKTPTSIAAINIITKQHDITAYDIPVLVICKSTLKYQWKDDGIKKFVGGNALVIDGTKAQRAKQYTDMRNYDYIITNYELLLKDIDILSKLSIGVLCADEAHKIRNHTTKTNKAACKLNARYKLFLTGSPIGSKPDEMFGICKVGNPNILGAYKKFSDTYLIKDTRYYNVIGYRNLDKLKEIVDTISIRRTMAEIEIQLPTMLPPQEIKLRMTPTQEHMDSELRNQLDDIHSKLSGITDNSDKRKAILENQVKSIVTLRHMIAISPELILMSQAAHVISKYAPMVTDIKSPKIELLQEHVSEIQESGDQVVIFTCYETATRIIARELKQAKIDCLTYTGKMDAKQKDATIQAFRANSGITALICTNAGAEGINLPNARYLINVDKSWDISTNEQRNYRINRVDSTYDRVFVFDYTTEGSIDESVRTANSRKQNLFDTLVENNEAQSQAIKQAMKDYK